MAPTSTSAMGPCSVSKMQTTRSLRANRRGTLRAVSGLTENSRPGTWTISRSVPATGMWTR